MSRKVRRDNRYLAKLVTGKKAPCAFCLREVDDEATFGKLYAIGDIQCHYFCCLLSCCLIQKGHDEEGLFGFLYNDIITEIERCKKHKCSYCGQYGANLGCGVGSCRKQFHLPCGREKNAVSLYYGNYKSFCQQHAPRQKIPDHIMGKARLRLKLDRMKKSGKELQTTGSKIPIEQGVEDGQSLDEMVCVVCYEAVDGFPTHHTFWPPCCARDAWFHRSCLQRMALSAGMHYLKCPLCNDKENFYDAVVSQGYYVPDRDAAWELEQNAFAEIYERPVSCCADICRCPRGREHDAENGKWDIKLCLLCGSAGVHAHCLGDQSQRRKGVASSVVQSQPRTDDRFMSLCQSQTENGAVTSEQSQMHCVAISLGQSQKATDSDALAVDQSQKATDSDKLSVDQSLQATDSDGLAVDQSQEAMDSDELAVDQLQKATDSDELAVDQSQPATESDELPVDQSQKATVSDELAVDQSQKATDSDELAVDQSQEATDSDELVVDESQKTTDSDELAVDQPQKANDSDQLAADQSKAWTYRYVCRSCLPAAPEDLDALANSIEALIQQEQAETVTNARRPVMPSRMSLRRTKARQAMLNAPSNSRSNRENDTSESHNVVTSRRELNLKTPSRLARREQAVGKDSIRDKLISPVKLIEQSFKEKMSCTGVRDAVLDETVIENLRRKFRKPRPLCAKKRIVNDILDGLFDNLMKDATKQEQLKEWCSPKKSYEMKKDSETLQTINEPSKIPEMNQDKESEQNTSNVTLKKADTVKDIVTEEEQVPLTNNNENDTNNNENGTNNSGNQTEVDIEATPTRINNENCRTTRNSASRTIINNEIGSNNNGNQTEIDIEATPTRNNNETCRTTRNSESRTIINNENGSNNSGNQTEIDIEATPTRNNNETCRTTRNSASRTIINNGNGCNSNGNQTEIDIEATPTRINNDTCRTTRNSASRTIINNENSNIANAASSEELNTSVIKQIICSKPKPCKRLSLKRCNSKNKQKTSRAVNKSSNNEISIRTNNEIIPNIVVNNDTTQKFEDQCNIQSKLSTLSIDKLENDGNILRRLLTGKGYQPETLSVTTEPINNNKEEPTEVLTETDINTPGSASKDLTETSKRKTIEIQHDSSLEISENDQSINIDVIKIDDSPTCEESYKQFQEKLPDKIKTCCFKFSPIDKETLKKEDLGGIDLESFKKEYLHEVDRDFKCNFSHDKTTDETQLCTVIDWAVDAALKKKSSDGDSSGTNRKRKYSERDLRLIFNDKSAKKRKLSESDLKLSYNHNEPENVETVSVSDSIVKKQQDRKKRKSKKNKRKSDNKNIEVTIDSSERRGKNKKKIKTKFAIQNENIHVKIKWKKKQLSLNIESKKQAKKEKMETHSKFQQYVLQFPDGSNDFLVKPEKEICPPKRKYVRQEKTPDKLKQMSIQSFFKK